MVSYKVISNLLQVKSILDLDIITQGMYKDRSLLDKGFLKDFYTGKCSKFKEITLPQVDNPHCFNKSILDLDIWKFLYSIASDELQKKEPHLFATHMMLKKGESNYSEVVWHQDGSFWKKEERLIESVSILIPTVATSKNNGGLRYLKTLYKNFLSRNSTSQNILIDKELDNKEGKDCETVLGDVIVHYPKSVHMSYPNLSKKDRNIFVAIFR